MAFIPFILYAAVFLALLFAGIFYYDRRYKSRREETQPQSLQGYHSTNEVFIDPNDGRKYRVYFNPRTGDRQYVEEQ